MATNNIPYLIAALVILVVLPCAYSSLIPYFSLEGFKVRSSNLAGPIQKFPNQTYEVLVQDSFPISRRYGVTNDQGTRIWKNYPIYQVGSYRQITNNHRYVKNPDNGTCMPAEICGSFYKSKRHQTNEVMPLPPVCLGAGGARVNYYNTEQNLLPYSNDATVNILY